MAAVKDIEVIPSAFITGRSRPLEDYLPRWKRWVVRQVWLRLGWASHLQKCSNCGHTQEPGDAIEFLEISTTEERARDVSNKPGGFAVELPINSSLPDVPCQFGAHLRPHSEAAEQYERHRSIPYEAVRSSDIKKAHELVHQARDIARTANAR